MMPVVRTLRNLSCRSLSDVLLFVRAWCLLGVYRLAIRTIPFRILARRFGVPQVESSHAVSDTDRAVVRRVSWAVQRASRFTPWKSNCFPQALTAQHLLSRRGIAATLYLGCNMKSETDMTAHAWLRSGTQIVTGKDGHTDYGVVASFSLAPTRVLR